jgi:hypothetical protein
MAAGMKPNSWYFHLVAEAFKTCINEEFWHQVSAAAARGRTKSGSSLAYPHGFLVRHFVGDRVQGSKSAADLGLFCFRDSDRWSTTVVD